MMATDVPIPLNFHDNSINFFRNWPTTTNNVVYIQKKNDRTIFGPFPPIFS